MSTEPDFALGASASQTPGAHRQVLPGMVSEGSGFQSQEQFWQAIKQNIKDRLGLERYSIWFQQAELMCVEDHRLVIGVPNVIIQQFLTARYTEAAAATVQELVGHAMEVSFDVAPRLFRQMRARQQAEAAEGEPDGRVPVRFQGVQDLHARRAQWGFENLIVTRSNKLPFAAARELAGQENPRFRFLYICGDYGLGKTALLRAIFALASAPEAGLNCVLMSAEGWCNQYYHAIQRKTTRPFRSRYRSCDLLLLDDVQFLQGKPAGQGELLHTIKHILGKGGRVALGGWPHPQQLQQVDAAFHALLRRAFPAAVLPPHEDERSSTVKELARKCGLQASDAVHELIARAHGDSFAGMVSAMSCLMLYAGVEGCGRIELLAAVDALAAMQPEADRPLGLPEIKEAVADGFAVGTAQLEGKARSRTICRARHVALYLARKLTGGSLSEIGRSFGGRSHSTVRHAVDKIAGELDTDSRLSALVERIERDLRHRP